MRWSGGECYYCGNRIRKDERPVMVKSGRRPDYAHTACVPGLVVVQGAAPTAGTELTRERIAENLRRLNSPTFEPAPESRLEAEEGKP